MGRRTHEEDAERSAGSARRKGNDAEKGKEQRKLALAAATIVAGRWSSDARSKARLKTKPPKTINIPTATRRRKASWPTSTNAAEINEEYAPEVRTLADGTKVQRTPPSTGLPLEPPVRRALYNTYWLDADNRGCNARHVDLKDSWPTWNTRT
ncbi:MAG: hypothetical protein ACLT98_07875 [Eggerthellaceae bacterium]